MNFYTLSLFPDMIANCFNTSITGRALAGGKLTLENINIRDFANNKHMKVDDYPYGGGAGLVMQLVYSVIHFEPRSLHHRGVIEVTKELLRK